MATTTERANIMKHILAVLEIDESIHENLAKEGYTTPRKIYGTTMKDLEDAMANQSLNKADQGDIKNLKGWMTYYTSSKGKNYSLCHLKHLTCVPFSIQMRQPAIKITSEISCFTKSCCKHHVQLNAP